jgi:hypothetical protein
MLSSTMTTETGFVRGSFRLSLLGGLPANVGRSKLVNPNVGDWKIGSQRENENDRDKECRWDCEVVDVDPSKEGREEWGRGLNARAEQY